MEQSHSCAILNNAAEARAFWDWSRKNQYAGKILSTHESVNDFFIDKGTSCISLSSFLSSSDCQEIHLEAFEEVKKGLSFLDEQWSGLFCQEIGIKIIPLFESLYSYLGVCEYEGIRKFEIGIDRYLKNEKAASFLYFESTPLSFFIGGDTFRKVLDRQSQAHNIRLKCLGTIKENGSPPFFSLLKRVLAYPDAQNFFSLMLTRSILFIESFFRHKSKENILMIEPLFDLNFLKKARLGKNIGTLIWKQNGTPLNFKKKYLLLEQHKKNIEQLCDRLFYFFSEAGYYEKNWHLYITLNNILNDFKNYSAQFLTFLKSLDEIIKDKKILFGVWGLGPINGFRALFSAYLMKKNIPVIGMQHGACYVVQDLGKRHLLSDFSRCTDYLTYGFSDEDYHRTYGPATKKPALYAVGSVKCENISHKRRHKPKECDVFFPITNATNLLKSASRILPHHLAETQRNILNFLNEIKNREVIVKPFPTMNRTNSGVFDTLQRMRNLKTIKNISTTSFLSIYHPKAVIIEYPSTPLYEVLGDDTEIFLFLDPVLPFEKNALELLEKRVYIFREFESFKSCFSSWTKGTLPPKRNNEFYNRFVYRPNAASEIISFFNKKIRYSSRSRAET